MGQPPLINQKVADLLKDRLVSAQLLIDLSKLILDERNEGFKQGYKHGVEWTCSRVKTSLDKTYTVMEDLA